MTPQDQPNPLKEILEGLAEQAINHRDSPHMVQAKILSHMAVIKAYFLDLIGEDEPLPDYILKSTDDTQRKYWQNKLRAELREKLK